MSSAHCDQCWKAWKASIQMANNMAQLASERPGNTAAGKTAAFWNAKVQAYYNQIRECCTDDEMSGRCDKIADPEMRRMCLGLPAPTRSDLPDSPPRRPREEDPDSEQDPSRPAPSETPPRDETPSSDQNPPRPSPSETSPRDEAPSSDRAPPRSSSGRKPQSGFGKPQVEDDWLTARAPDPNENLASPTETLLNLAAMLRRINLEGIARMVDQVRREANSVSVGSPRYIPLAEVLILENRLTVEDLNVDDMGSGTQIEGNLEEIVHAFMDMFSNSALVRAITVAGRGDYNGARVENENGSDRRVSRDPERVFQEAVAGYAARRIATYFTIRDLLGRLRARGVLTEDSRLVFRTEYNRGMAARKFGYENVGDEQYRSRLDIPERMRRIIDEQLLGGRIPDSFDDVDEFNQFIRQ